MTKWVSFEQLKATVSIPQPVHETGARSLFVNSDRDHFSDLTDCAEQPNTDQKVKVTQSELQG